MHKISRPDEPAAAEIAFEDFAKVDIRVGTVLTADPFPEARKPAYRLTIDFGPTIGVRKSSAQITDLYSLDELVGRTVMAVVNFPPRQIGPVRSEVLVLGFPDDEGHIVLAAPGLAVPNGARLA
ncbi:tRNA-binding protein [Phenylobacterium sp. Root77]|jgi:tRNA-binding protein|uniref:tRNA-binding protein n=1 Tax=unclassified Phenylobacterium TaxID=2640670 RepID=UPI0006FF422A|nr:MULTISPECIES: tRNA-binding protein [unclassified Phenylobacterium]KQW71361.1 tRNA-binding protein [Phenylobacterium sp. Root1277]KQW94282.1 tRNA-binding protein [Phenylobacterium sp. Root1290]KRC43975.1 tRNA-binding protein [Phenylobacterium sp. Root77]